MEAQAQTSPLFTSLQRDRLFADLVGSSLQLGTQNIEHWKPTRSTARFALREDERVLLFEIGEAHNGVPSRSKKRSSRARSASFCSRVVANELPIFDSSR